MSERFFISGVQMGLLRRAVHGCKCEKKVMEMMAEIEDKQFIGQMSEDFEIVICRKGEVMSKAFFEHFDGILSKDEKKAKTIDAQEWIAVIQGRFRSFVPWDWWSGVKNGKK